VGSIIVGENGAGKTEIMYSAKKKIDDNRGDLGQSEFISYGLELGKQRGDSEFEHLSHKLQSLGGSAKVKSS